MTHVFTKICILLRREVKSEMRDAYGEGGGTYPADERTFCWTGLSVQRASTLESLTRICPTEVFVYATTAQGLHL